MAAPPGTHEARGGVETEVEVEVEVDEEEAAPVGAAAVAAAWAAASPLTRLAAARYEPDEMVSIGLLAKWELRSARALAGAALWLYNTPPSMHATPNLWTRAGNPRSMEGQRKRTLEFVVRETDTARVGARHWRVSVAQSALSAARRAHGVEATAEAVRMVLQARAATDGQPNPMEVHAHALSTQGTGGCDLGVRMVGG
jgi:hypothetical protein